MNMNDGKKKKKTEPIIVTKVEPIPGSKPVQTSHYEPSWYKPSPVIDPSTSSYYPAGQRVIEQQGLEYNYDNFIQQYGSNIGGKDITIIKSSNKNRIKQNNNTNLNRYSLLTTIHYFFLAIFVGSGGFLVFSLGYNISVQNEITIINFWDVIFYLIIFIVSFIGSWKLKNKTIILKQTLEAGKLKLDEIYGDAAYSSVKNLQIVDKFGGTAYIPFKKNATCKSGGALWKKAYHNFQLHRDEFDKHYHQRSNAEATFAAIKMKFGETIKSRNRVAQKNEMLCKVIAYNITVLIHAMFELGITPDFSQASM